MEKVINIITKAISSSLDVSEELIKAGYTVQQRKDLRYNIFEKGSIMCDYIFDSKKVVLSYTNY